MKATTLMSLLLAATVEAQIVYLIRHGEKPADGGNGLTTQGMQRAQCLRQVFGNQSSYNIGYIIAEQPKSSESLSSSPIRPKPKNTEIRSTIRIVTVEG